MIDYVENEGENEKYDRCTIRHKHINRPRPRHGHKYTKYKMWHSTMWVICIKQRLSHIWNSFHEKTKQHWGRVEKKVLLIKKSVLLLSKYNLTDAYFLINFEHAGL